MQYLSILARAIAASNGMTSALAKLNSKGASGGQEVSELCQGNALLTAPVCRNGVEKDNLL